MIKSLLTNESDMGRFMFTSVVRIFDLIILKSVNYNSVNTVCDKQSLKHKKSRYLSIAAFLSSSEEELTMPGC
jgi:hypothetical protein